MSLADLIRKHDAGRIANAIPAIPAIPTNDSDPDSGSLAGIATLALANPAEAKADAPCRHWQIHFTDREPLEVIFSDDLTHGEALAIYPAAVAALPWTVPTNEPEPVSAPADPFPSLPTCEQCLNLRQRDRDGFRRCTAAARGELRHIASKRYAPAPDPGRRCEAYTPGPSEADQRTGAERWPFLLE